MVYAFNMVFQGAICCYQDVVHIDSELSRVDLVFEDVVHEALECGRGIAQSKEHHFRLVESSLGFEGGLPLVFLYDGAIVVSPSYVDFGEPFLSCKLVDDIFNKW